MVVPAFLSEIVRTIIVMTISGGAIILLLLAIKPFIRNRLPKAAQYYFWLVVLLALLVPVSRIFVLPERAENIAPIPIAAVVERNVISITEENNRIAQHPMHQVPNWPEPGMVMPTFPVGYTITLSSVPVYVSSNFSMVTVSTIFMFVYPWVVLLVLAYNLIGYALFAKKLRRGYASPHKEELELLAQLIVNTHKKPRLYISEFALTPMLIGILRPTIVLPNREYTHEQLKSILLHELTHMRRFDIAVKWMSLFACAIHWFNPLVWVARREIDRNCELSCDAAVVRDMDNSSKQNYGNTLIDVATDTKIPLPVLSTTMCEEKRALKERLSAIMKSKKHTKFAAFVSMVIILLAVFASCTLGAARRASIDDVSDEGNGYTAVATTEPPQEVSQVTPPHIAPTSASVNDFAHMHIASISQTFEGPHVSIVESRINRFEKIAEFDHILPQTIELWKLDFALRVDYEPFIRWGTFEPDADGWISQAVGFHGSTFVLILARTGDSLEYMGAIQWWWDITEEPWSLENALRRHLENENILAPVTFPGNHYVVYVQRPSFSEWSEDMYHRILLSQPVTQGPGGIWAVERWQHFGEWGFGTVMHADPKSAILTMTEYFSQQQQLFDVGLAPHLSDPEAVVFAFVHSWYQEGISPSQYNIIGIRPVSPGISNPLEQPNVYGPSPSYWRSHTMTSTESTPINFFGSFIEEYSQIRERAISEIGGLAFNEAYHFRMDDGRYALVTGWRPMISREELIEFFPHLDVPVQVGDFNLVGITINDRLFDGIRIYNNPVPSEANGRPAYYYTEGILPLNQVFTRNMWIYSFYAVYVNSSGNYVGMAVLPTFEWDSPALWFDPLPFTMVDMKSHGEIYFIGANNRYATAFLTNAETLIALEWAFLDPSNLPPIFWGWSFTHNFSGVLSAPMDALNELVYTFNTGALFEEFNWRLHR